MDEIVGPLITWAKKPCAGLSSRNDKWFFADAWKNQIAFGKAGRLNGLPPNPSDKPNGSFHKPKPHVPGINSEEARRLKLKVKGGCMENSRRRSAPITVYLCKPKLVEPRFREIVNRNPLEVEEMDAPFCEQ